MGGAVQYGEERTDMENILDAYLSDQPWFDLPNGCREIAHGTCSIEIPSSLNARLRPYQETGFNWLAGLQKFGFGGILGNDMGLGKTIQVLTLLLYLIETGTRPHSTLLILPKTLAWNWETEIKKFAPSQETKIHLGQGRDRSPGTLYFAPDETAGVQGPPGKNRNHPILRIQ